jgi:hypothetical protein
MLPKNNLTSWIVPHLVHDTNAHVPEIAGLVAELQRAQAFCALSK